MLRKAFGWIHASTVVRVCFLLSSQIKRASIGRSAMQAVDITAIPQGSRGMPTARAACDHVKPDRHGHDQIEPNLIACQSPESGWGQGILTQARATKPRPRNGNLQGQATGCLNRIIVVCRLPQICALRFLTCALWARPMTALSPKQTRQTLKLRHCSEQLMCSRKLL